MNNQILIRLGRPKRYKIQRQPKQHHPIKIFIIKWLLVIGVIYLIVKYYNLI